MSRYEHACVQCCFIEKLLINLYPSSGIVYNVVYITIANHNDKRNIREKDASLLWNRSSRQCDFNHPPFYREFMTCIALIVHVFLPSPMQTYSHGMFSLLPLPRLPSSYKMHVSKLTIRFDQVESATKCGIANQRRLCFAVFNSKTSLKYAPIFKQSVG